MNYSLLKQARDEGTPAWDNVFQKALYIALVFATGARNSDATKGLLDTRDLAALEWKDVEIKMMNGETIEDLVAEVTIRTEKGLK